MARVIPFYLNPSSKTKIKSSFPNIQEQLPRKQPFQMSVKQDCDTPQTPNPDTKPNNAPSPRRTHTTLMMIILVLIASFVVGAYLGHLNSDSQEIRSEIARMKENIHSLEYYNQELRRAYSRLSDLTQDQSNKVLRNKNAIAYLENQYQQQKAQNEQIFTLLSSRNVGGAPAGMSQKEKNEMKAELEAKLKDLKNTTSLALAEIKTDLREQYRKLARIDDQTRQNFETTEALGKALNVLEAHYRNLAGHTQRGNPHRARRNSFFDSVF